jgi:hypothetical protein
VAAPGGIGLDVVLGGDRLIGLGALLRGLVELVDVRRVLVLRVAVGAWSSPSGSASVAGSAAAVAVAASASATTPASSSTVGSGARLTPASSICATSSTSTSSRAAPSDCLSVSPSDSMTRQNGQPTAIWSAPVAMASSVRLTLMREPIVSSIHMRAPPAPQQKDFSLLRGISVNSAPGMTLSSSRGGS